MPLTFDKASTTYPPELDIALQAWRAAVTEGKGKPKARIKAWFETNAKELPDVFYIEAIRDARVGRNKHYFMV